jgi:hypothetical protein
MPVVITPKPRARDKEYERVMALPWGQEDKSKITQIAMELQGTETRKDTLSFLCDLMDSKEGFMHNLSPAQKRDYQIFLDAQPKPSALIREPYSTRNDIDLVRHTPPHLLADAEAAFSYIKNRGVTHVTHDDIIKAVIVASEYNVTVSPEMALTPLHVIGATVRISEAAEGQRMHFSEVLSQNQGDVLRLADEMRQSQGMEGEAVHYKYMNPYQLSGEGKISSVVDLLFKPIMRRDTEMTESILRQLKRDLSSPEEARQKRIKGALGY